MIKMKLEARYCILSLLCCAVYYTTAVHGQRCPPIVCESHTLACRFPTYFADVYSQTVCRGCNLCIKPGSPLDSDECPLMQCPGPFPRNMCRDPRYYNSWVVYDNRKCPTCWANLCKLKSA